MRTGHVGLRIQGEASSAANYSYRVEIKDKNTSVDVLSWSLNVEARKYLQIGIGKSHTTIM